MTKSKVQQRVLKNGGPLDVDLFSWDEENKIFISSINGLMIDFGGIANCTFIIGSNCNIETGPNCIIKTGTICTITASHSCNIETGLQCTITTRDNCVIKTNCDSVINTDYNCIIETQSNCTIKTWVNSTLIVGTLCVINAGPNCTIKAGDTCTIVRRDEFEIIIPLKDEVIQICPPYVKGFLADGYLNRDTSLGKHIIKDNILRKVGSKKRNILKDINHNKNSMHCVQNEDINSHDKSSKEFKNSLILKSAIEMLQSITI